MDWITSLQRIIDYIEEHILEDIDLEKIGSINYSISYLQKIFNVVCNMSISSYVKMRRMTLAANEVLFTDKEISDIAFSYRYKNTESFSRAFKNFHGVNPSVARARHAKLRNFSPIHLKLDITGGNSLNYKIIEKDSFNVIEKIERQPVLENEDFKSVINYWRRSHRNGTIKKLLKTTKDKKHFYGIYYDNTIDSDSVEYSVAVMDDNNSILPEGFHKRTIPKRTWAVFECVGPMPKAMQKLWHEIWTEVFPTALYKPTGEFEIEVYNDGNEKDKNYHCEAWVSIKKKQN